MKYVRNKYNIDKNIEYTEEPIKQKWNGVAQHLAYYITQQTDVLILTIFSTLGNVAIYSVYYIVTNGISVLIYSLNNGTQALLGNMLAKNEHIKLNKFYNSMEWIIHNVVVFLYSCVAMLIVPFVMVYTQGVNDINYYQPVFAAFITASSAIYCIRLPYNMMVLAAGHYKQTQNSSIIEMCLNVGLTLVLVNKYGLVGAAIGTLVALTYRTVYLAYYLSKNIINHKFSIFIKRLIEDIILTILIIISTSYFRLEVYSYLGWFLLAVKVAIIAILEMVIFNYLFERKKTMAAIHKVIKRK
jgi:O-antigen/teichoic acid export membrane protein